MSDKDYTKLAVNQTFCEDQNSFKNIVCGKDSTNSYIKQNKAHDDINRKSFICDGEV